MRITFILPRLGLAGGIRVLATYAKTLRDRGHEVFVVSTPTSSCGWRRWLTSWFDPGSQEIAPSHFDNVEVPLVRLNDRAILADRHVPDADVVVATLWRTAAPVMRLAARKGAKVYFIQGYETFNAGIGEGEKVDETWRLPMHKITVSGWLTRLAEERFGDLEVSTVHNAVDTELFTAPPRLKQKILTVGFIYNRVWIKGVDICLEALRQLAGSGLPLRVVAFGEAAGVPHLPLPAQCKLEVSPSQKRIPGLYAACDAWIVPSRSEGFGLPLLEAMGCRTPVISTPVGAAPELLGCGGGVLVPHEDPAALATAIQGIAALSGEAWIRMSEAAHATASRYSWNDATLEFEKALERAVDRARRGEIAGGAS
jgi:glycosyltransferase involved in cell wall biosynthesis